MGRLAWWNRWVHWEWNDQFSSILLLDYFSSIDREAVLFSTSSSISLNTQCEGGFHFLSTLIDISICLIIFHQKKQFVSMSNQNDQVIPRQRTQRSVEHRCHPSVASPMFFLQTRDGFVRQAGRNERSFVERKNRTTSTPDKSNYDMTNKIFWFICRQDDVDYGKEAVC